MKNLIRSIAIAVLFLIGSTINAQTSCCNARAGKDRSVCCPEGSTTLGSFPTATDTCSACDTVLYRWFPTTGLNNPQAANPIASPTVTTSYTLCIYVVNTLTQDTCCSDCDTVNITVNTSCCRVGSTQYNSTEAQALVSIVPNPSNGVFSIAFDSAVENAQIRIYDVTGRLIWNKSGASGNSVLADLSGNSPGVYLVQILDKEELIYNNKLIIE